MIHLTSNKLDDSVKPKFPHARGLAKVNRRNLRQVDSERINH
jgi:hypothetical protein